MEIKRRDFLKLMGVASASMLPDVAAATTPDDLTHDNPFGVLVDTTLCIGCRKCEFACNNEHGLTDKSSASFEDKSVLEQMRRPDAEAYTVVNSIENPDALDGKSYMKVQCMHCNEPACVSACIVGALDKCEHGPVTYDAWKCIGCRYCMVACPFQIPAYEYAVALAPKVMKCTFCSERVHDGKKPACVSICPEEALTFGKRGDLIKLARSKMRVDPDRYFDHIYGEHEVGGTSWMYLSDVDFSKTELPMLDSDPLPEKTEKIQHGIFKSFLPPLALYGLLGLIMHSARQAEREKETGDE